MNSQTPVPNWEILQSQLPKRVLDTLIAQGLWTIAEGPSEGFKNLTRQFERYFGLYPNSETLKAEFEVEFGFLNKVEQDALFRLMKSVEKGRPFLQTVD